MEDGSIMDATPLSDASLAKADCVAILTDHSDFDYNNICAKAHMVFDSRNATKNVPKGVGRVWKL